MGFFVPIHDANIDFLNKLGDYGSSKDNWKIRTLPGQLPAAYFGGLDGVTFYNSAVGSGAHLAQCKIVNSIIGRDVRIGKGAFIENAVLFQGSRVGDNCIIINAILDHKVKIAAGEQIGVDTAADIERGFTVSDGIVVLASFIFSLHFLKIPLRRLG